MEEMNKLLAKRFVLRLQVIPSVSSAVNWMGQGALILGSNGSLR